jgi:hypothetical protein
MATKKNPEPQPERPLVDLNNSTSPEDTQFLISVAENALRDAIQKAAPFAHGAQIQTLTFALTQVQSASHALTHDPEYFNECDNDD